MEVVNYNPTLLYVLIYFLIFRLTVILLGGISIYLGYRLFIQVLPNARSHKPNDATTLEAVIGDKKISLSNAAPGIFFSFFGSIIVIVVLAGNPPEFKSMNSPNEANSKNSLSKDTVGSIYNETTVRAGNDIPETAEALYKASNNSLKDAFYKISRAISLDPNPSEYHDLIAGLHFIYNDFAKAKESQNIAIESASDNSDISAMKRRLNAYQAANE